MAGSTLNVHSVPILALAATLCFASGASAQSSTTRGVLLGAHVGMASIKVENAERSSGGGAGIMAGYGLNRMFTLFVQVDGTKVDVRNQPDVAGTWTMAHADLGARFFFANSQRTAVPYLVGAVSGRIVSVSDIPATSPLSGNDVSFSGGSLTLGGGVMLYVNETLAFDLGLLFGGGKFTEITVDNTTQTGFDIDAQSRRFNLGVAWWP